MTNQLSKKMNYLKNEKVELEVIHYFCYAIYYILSQRTLEREQEYQVNKLMRRIERQERELVTKHTSIDQVIITITTGKFHIDFDLVETRKSRIRKYIGERTRSFGKQIMEEVGSIRTRKKTTTGQTQ